MPTLNYRYRQSTLGLDMYDFPTYEILKTFSCLLIGVPELCTVLKYNLSSVSSYVQPSKYKEIFANNYHG